MEQIAAPGLNPNPQVNYENPNYMNRIVQWFRDDEISTIVKVGALVLAAIALIGLGFLAGQPILIPLLTALPFTLWAGREWLVLNENETKRIAQEAVEAMERVEAAPVSDFEKMKAAIGGEAEFEQLPVLVLNHANREYIDWLKCEDLAFPVMKGVFIDRQFISVKVKDAEQGGKVFVITFFQRSVHNDSWAHGSKEIIFKNPFLGPLRAKDRTLIHQVVVQKNHPRFALAE